MVYCPQPHQMVPLDRSVCGPWQILSLVHKDYPTSLLGLTNLDLWAVLPCPSPLLALPQDSQSPFPCRDVSGGTDPHCSSCKLLQAGLGIWLLSTVADTFHGSLRGHDRDHEAHNLKYLPCVCLVTQSSPTLCDPLWAVAGQAPLSMEFPRQEFWSGLPFPSAGDLPNPGTEPQSPALQVDSLPSDPLL